MNAKQNSYTSVTNETITPIMIVGSAKCGTSSLYDYLGKHPNICKGITKEPEYFTLKRGDEFKGGSYFDLFKIDTSIHEFTIDGSTGYSMCHAEKGVPERMKNYGLNPFFIYIVRNPFERIRSHYNFNKRKLEWKEKIDSPHLINTSMYFKQIEEYKNVFGNERIILVEFDELKNNPTLLCNKIFEFISAENFQIDSEKIEVKNETRPINRTRLQIFNTLLVARNMVPPFIRSWIRDVLTNIFPDKQNYLSEKQKSRIKLELKDDMNSLKNKYNIDISKWGF